MAVEVVLAVLVLLELQLVVDLVVTEALVLLQQLQVLVLPEVVAVAVPLNLVHPEPHQMVAVPEVMEVQQHQEQRVLQTQAVVVAVDMLLRKQVATVALA